tara:strand:- start:1556 stop:2080 length:525 start_codon:yes stop_codon:yes gene_type:complete
MGRLADGYITLRILKMLSTPIEKTKAYELGLVDSDGKQLKKAVSTSEKDSYSMLQRFVFKVQRSLMKSPDRNSKRLLTLAAALSILKENDELDDLNVDALLEMYSSFEDVEQTARLLEYNLLSFNTFLDEEVAANSAGSGSVDGIGVGDEGEPGKDALIMPMIRRKKKKKYGNS